MGITDRHWHDDPETIEVKEVLPSHDTGDAGQTMLSPEQIVQWKEEFVRKFGDDGYVEKGLHLPWMWSAVGNEKFDEWKNNYLTAKGNWIERERNRGRTSGLD